MRAIVIGRQQQFAMADVDQPRQRAGAVQQEVAVRRLRRAVAELMDVEMGVELDHQDAFGLGGQLVVDRQGAEMVAGDPEEEVAGPQGLPRRLPSLLAPAGVILDGFKGEFLQPHLVGVGCARVGELSRRLSARISRNSSAMRAAPAPAPPLPKRSNGKTIRLVFMAAADRIAA